MRHPYYEVGVLTFHLAGEISALEGRCCGRGHQTPIGTPQPMSSLILGHHVSEANERRIQAHATRPSIPQPELTPVKHCVA